MFKQREQRMVVRDLHCPNCGGTVSYNQKICEFCGGTILITSVNKLPSSQIEIQKYLDFYSQASQVDNENVDFSRGLCFLKLQQYDSAIDTFEKLIEKHMFNANLYFYAGIALLEGKKAFQAKKSAIDKIISYLNSALAIEDKGIYRIFLAYIKYDYFKRKFLNITPNYSQELHLGEKLGYSDTDFEELWDILGVAKPDIF